jgi:UDP-3-O-[3-hydroxymyristoyl] N-acetylglucosamine deacetylase
MSFQHTLQQNVSFSDIGIFTGKVVTVTLQPAPVDTGIVFKRLDLPGQPLIPAHVDYVTASTRCTLLQTKLGSVQTVEHLLAAIRGTGLDNVIVEMTGPEIPIFDGSAQPFLDYIQQAKLVKQEKERSVFSITSPLYYSGEGMHLIALPSHEYRISYTLHYPASSYLKSQYYSVAVDSESFASQIAICRTFTLYEDIAPLIEKGVLKGGGLDNAVVIRGDKILNPSGVRFPDEMVRHKILDIIGDLALTGFLFNAHIIAIRTGHSANHAFARQLVNHIRKA